MLFPRIYSPILAILGAKSESEQLEFYLTTFAILAASYPTIISPLRTAYLVEGFVTTTDSDQKILYAARAKMSSVEMRAAPYYLEMLKNKAKINGSIGSAILLIYATRKWLL